MYKLFRKTWFFNFFLLVGVIFSPSSLMALEDEIFEEKVPYQGKTVKMQEQLAPFIFGRPLKLMTLNVWGGSLKDPLLKFIGDHSDVDIFCFQEVYHGAPYPICEEEKATSDLDIFSHLEESLPLHRGFFLPFVETGYGVATFIKKEISVVDQGSILVHEDPIFNGRGLGHPRKLQWLKCSLEEGKEWAILNLHGVCPRVGKGDTPEGLAQAGIIRSFMDKLDIPHILCGDFNLKPDTECMKILGEKGSNLVTKYGIQSTRTSIYKKPERFADYIIISHNLREKSFCVKPEEVSDHNALLLEF